MAWHAQRAAALLEAFVPSVAAWARRGTAHGLQDAPAVTAPAQIVPAGIDAHADEPDAEPGADRGVSREVLDALRLPPEVEQPLLDIGMPPDGSEIYDGPRRGADKAEVAARKFVVWARAIGATGTYPTGVVCALYAECAAADHRDPVSDNRFLYALKHTAGVRKDTSAKDRRRRLWIIEPAPPPEPAAAPEEPAPQPKVVSKPALNRPRLMYRFIPEQEYASPAWTQAKAKEARRLGRARKQRGSRASRRAA